MNTNPLESIAEEMLNTIGVEASLELLDRLREVMTTKTTEVGEDGQYGDRTKETQTQIAAF